MTDRGGSSPIHAFLARHPRLPAAAPYLLIVLCGTVAYGNTLGVPFNFDDLNAVLNNPLAKDLSMFVNPVVLNWRRGFGDFTFAVNYRLHGTAPAGYHLANLGIHLLCACLVLLLVKGTFRALAPARGGADPELARDADRFAGRAGLLAALLFVAHPLQTQAVTYIVQRYTSLAALLYLAVIILYGNARRRQRGAVPGGRTGTFFLFGLALVTAFLALRTKEIAFTLPLAVVLYEVLFIRERLGVRLRHVCWFLLPLLLLAGGIVAAGGLSPRLIDRVSTLTRESQRIPRLDYLLTEFRVVATYLRLLFVPVGQRLEYDYPVSRSLAEPAVLAALILHLALVGAALLFTVRSRRMAAARPVEALALRLAAFGIFWFYLTLAIESSLIPITDVIFEHRLYLPSVGAAIACAAGLVFLAERLAPVRPRLTTGVAVLCGVAVIGLTAATVARNRVWRTEATLWEDTVAKSPNLSRPLNNLASIYLRTNEPERALSALVRANALDPGYPDTWINIGIALDRLDSYGDRFRTMWGMVDATGNVLPGLQRNWFGLAWNNLGLAKEILGDSKEALACYRRAVAYTPELAEARYNLGLALAAAGDRQGSEEQLRALVPLNPRLARTLYMRALQGKESPR
jgi:tetratricopeptide (TPR) repeat protein